MGKNYCSLSKVIKKKKKANKTLNSLCNNIQDHVREGEKMKMMMDRELMLFFIFLFLIRRVNDLITNF